MNPIRPDTEHTRSCIKMCEFCFSNHAITIRVVSHSSESPPMYQCGWLEKKIYDKKQIVASPGKSTCIDNLSNIWRLHCHKGYK